MKFGYAILYVNDVLATIDFYQKAFSLELSFLTESGYYAQMNTGETALGFVSESFVKEDGGHFVSNRPDATPPGFNISLVTDDVHHAYEQALTAGAKPLMPPTQKPWGQTVSTVADINGIIVEICSPVYPS